MELDTMYTGEVNVGQWINYKPCWLSKKETIPFQVKEIYPNFVLAESDNGVRECFPLVNRDDVLTEEFDSEPERMNKKVRDLIDRTGLSMRKLSVMMGKYETYLSSMAHRELTEVKQNMLMKEITKMTGVA